MAYSIKSLGFGKVAVVHNNKHIKTFNGVGAPQDARNYINNQYKSSQPGATTGKIPTHEAAANIYLNMQLDEQINEVLSKDAEAGEWIKDFIESDNPKFEGKSTADRKKMALAAYYAKQRNESVELLDEMNSDLSKISTEKLQARWDANKDEKYPSPVFANHLKAVNKELQKRKQKQNESTNLGNEAEFTVTKPGSRWKKAPKQDVTGKPEKSLEYADKETSVKEDISEATVKTSHGVKTVKHGKDFSVVLHPEHQEAINKLKDEQEHKFKDETGQHWIARRKGEDVHFQSADLNGSMKTHVPASSLSEDHTPTAPVPGQRDKDTAVMVHPETKQRVVILRKNIGNYSDWKEVGPGQKLKENLSFANMNFDGEVVTESIVIDLSESKYEDYFKAMMKKAGITSISDIKSEDARKEFMDAVDAGYKAKNESVLAEEYLRTDIEKKIENHEKLGHKVVDVKHTIRGGKPYSEYVVTTPEGNKKKHVFHGDVQRHENLV